MSGDTILGLNLYFHDSAAALLRQGQLLAAIEEERWYRDDKHTRVFPRRSIEYCLSHLGDREGLTHIAVNMQPLRCLSDAPTLSWYAARPNLWSRKHWRNYLNRRKACVDTRTELWLLLRALGRDKSFRYHLVPHHEAHAASAFDPSPFEESAVLCIDANGEWPTTTLWHGRGCELRCLETVGLPHSIGALYACITEYLGFQRNNDEYKVMGLASYGDAGRFAGQFDGLIRAVSPGLFRLDQRYFDYLDYKLVPSQAFRRLFGIPPREREAEIHDVHRDLAAGVQHATERIVLHILRELQARTQSKRLCLAGGVALNCVMNQRILEAGGFEELFVQPASHDAGGALGAACWVESQLLRRPRRFVMDRADWGPSFSDSEIEAILRRGMLPARAAKDVPAETARLLADGKIVGWFQGRAEFGPRALGYRSILADPTSPVMQDHLNRRVKHREDFRPFAPACTAEDFSRWFNTTREEPFMTSTCRVRQEALQQLPAVSHIDGTARLQTVREEKNPLFHALLRAFSKLRGVPILLNTSFNVRGEPMVLTPHDAIRCFYTTGIDALVMGSFVLEKGN